MDKETMKNLIFLMRMFEKRVGEGDSFQSVKKWIEEKAATLAKTHSQNKTLWK